MLLLRRSGRLWRPLRTLSSVVNHWNAFAPSLASIHAFETLGLASAGVSRQADHNGARDCTLHTALPALGTTTGLLWSFRGRTRRLYFDSFVTIKLTHSGIGRTFVGLRQGIINPELHTTMSELVSCGAVEACELSIMWLRNRLRRHSATAGFSNAKGLESSIRCIRSTLWKAAPHTSLERTITLVSNVSCLMHLDRLFLAVSKDCQGNIRTRPLL